jgi:hypothetical protein
MEETGLKKIEFDTGVEEYAVGNGVLRFNPCDPNVYGRFLQASDKLREIAGKDASMEEADRAMKRLLDWIFGPGNDFNAITGGVSLLATATNGQQVISNLLAALEPVVLAGAERCAQSQERLARQEAGL